MLRYIEYICFKDYVKGGNSNNTIYIVTGPRIKLAIIPINRFKRLFENTGVTIPETKETVAIIPFNDNNTTTRIDTMRARYNERLRM